MEKTMIGVIGQGFVGSAIREGLIVHMKNYVKILTLFLFVYQHQ